MQIDPPIRPWTGDLVFVSPAPLSKVEHPPDTTETHEYESRERPRKEDADDTPGQVDKNDARDNAEKQVFR
jgi:hypothetical protein